MTDFEEFISLLDRKGITYTASWDGDYMEVKLRSSSHNGVVGDPGATSIFRFTQWGGLLEVENVAYTPKEQVVLDDEEDAQV